MSFYSFNPLLLFEIKSNISQQKTTGSDPIPADEPTSGDKSRQKAIPSRIRESCPVFIHMCSISYIYRYADKSHVWSFYVLLLLIFSFGLYCLGFLKNSTFFFLMKNSTLLGTYKEDCFYLFHFDESNELISVDVPSGKL